MKQNVREMMHLHCFNFSKILRFVTSRYLEFLQLVQLVSPSFPFQSKLLTNWVVPVGVVTT